MGRLQASSPMSFWENFRSPGVDMLFPGPTCGIQRCHKSVLAQQKRVLPDGRRCCTKVPYGIASSVAAKFRERNPRTIINWDLFATLAGFWENSAMDNIGEEYDRLVEHFHDCAKKAKSFKTTKRRLSLETLELIRQRGAARTAGNQELTSELARLQHD
ncbi:hypothetical protein RB195_023966 [Necator americanus]|uniref:HMG box domain-containing protein n=1 Tax=Necator americanus TaxID=51031 RepID=A0ABR1ENP3_NECAM